MTFIYTPDPNENGTDSFDISFESGDYTVTKNIDVLISFKDDDPTIAPNDINMLEDTESPRMTVQDVDKDPVVKYSISGATKGIS